MRERLTCAFEPEESSLQKAPDIGKTQHRHNSNLHVGQIVVCQKMIEGFCKECMRRESPRGRGEVCRRSGEVAESKGKGCQFVFNALFHGKPVV